MARHRILGAALALLAVVLSAPNLASASTSRDDRVATGSDSFVQLLDEPGAGGGSSIFVGDGYALAFADSGIGDAYVLRPLATHGRSAELVPLLEDLAAELTLATGADVTVGSAVSVHTETPGTITVELATTSGCGPLSSTIIGCGGFAAGDDHVVQYGWAWLHPSVLDDERVARAGLGHEVGHALALKHFDGQWDDETQLMHSTLADQTLRRYRSGDVRGLQRAATNGYLEGVPAPALPPLAPTALVVSSGSAMLRGSWRVVDQGSALLAHEVEVGPPTGPGTVTGVGPGRSASIGPLTLGSSMRMRVRAANVAGFGPWSQWSAPIVIVDPCAGPFPDVGAAHPFCTQITWLVDVGIAAGFADGTYRPGAAVSRQAMAAFLRRFTSREDPDPTIGPWPVAGFPDVPAGSAFEDDIDWLVAEGIAVGYEDGGFHPTAPISRQAMAAFLRRLAAARWGDEAAAIEPGTEAFPDVPVGHPFHDDVAWMRDRGLSTGTPDAGCGCSLFQPGEAVSRQAMAAFLLGLDGLAPAP